MAPGVWRHPSTHLRKVGTHPTHTTKLPQPAVCGIAIAPRTNRQPRTIVLHPPNPGAFNTSISIRDIGLRFSSSSPRCSGSLSSSPEASVLGRPARTKSSRGPWRRGSARRVDPRWIRRARAGAGRRQASYIGKINRASVRCRTIPARSTNVAINGPEATAGSNPSL